MTTLDVALIGGGRLAEVMSRLLGASSTPQRVTHWARNPDVARAFAERNPHVRACATLADAARDARVVVLAVPAMGLDEVAAAYGEVARGDQIVLHACRGVGEGFRLAHQLIRARTSVRKIVALGGPLHSRELGTGRVLAAVAASRFADGVEAVRAMTAGTPVRVHPTQDVVGVEVATAMSNVWALAAGMCDGLELGDTARGLLLTRGLVEAQRIGLALGAEPATFAGLAGLGDLIPRKVSSTERHHTHGALVAQGKAEHGPLLEGVVTAEAARALGVSRRLKLPLVDAVGSVLSGARPAREVLEHVLTLDLEDLVLPRASAR
jgi:glycerol-3-phosphate dehydrogenase (NAD(P)+)